MRAMALRTIDAPLFLEERPEPALGRVDRGRIEISLRNNN